MPKKFIGENSKAAEARARKAAQQHEEETRKKREEEDEYWKDEDKHVMKKQQRKAEKEKKMAEHAEKKQELRKLHDEEMSSIKAKSAAAQPVTKLTRAQIDTQRQRDEAAAKAAALQEGNPDEEPLIENLNRIQVDGDEARTIDEALHVLGSAGDKVDMHPEKRMKAAYTKYEDENLPTLKLENPNMRLSQLKQLLKKQWMKSPENPLNQRMAIMNAK